MGLIFSSWNDLSGSFKTGKIKLIVNKKTTGGDPAPSRYIVQRKGGGRQGGGCKRKEEFKDLVVGIVQIELLKLKISNSPLSPSAGNKSSESDALSE